MDSPTCQAKSTRYALGTGSGQDRAQERLDREPGRMELRRQTVEHPYGTIEAWMGYTHFQMKTLDRVSTETSLHVLAYNLKRMINILTSGAFNRSHTGIALNLRRKKVFAHRDTGSFGDAYSKIPQSRNNDNC